MGSRKENPTARSSNTGGADNLPAEFLGRPSAIHNPSAHFTNGRGPDRSSSENEVPFSGELLKVTVPPCASAQPRTRVSPNPQPGANCVAAAVRLNGENKSD